MASEPEGFTDQPEGFTGQHEKRLEAMLEVACQAGDQTLTRFRKPTLEVETKSDASPVTAADRDAEMLVREWLSARFPHDTLQGEEFAEQTGTSPYRWIVDPIDGTKSFVCGVPLYSTLLGLEHEGRPIAGAIYIPACGEMIVGATGLGAWYGQGRKGGWARASVSSCERLADAVFVTSQVDGFDHRGAGSSYRELEAAARITRTWGDGYGYLMVATGRADVMVDPTCNAWDVAAILPIVQEAGGRFSDWKGEPTVRGGDGVGTNGRIHDEVLAKLR